MIPGELVTASLFGAIHRLFTLASVGTVTQAQPVDWYSREGKTGRKESETPVCCTALDVGASRWSLRPAHSHSQVEVEVEPAPSIQPEQVVASPWPPLSRHLSRGSG